MVEQGMPIQFVATLDEICFGTVAQQSKPDTNSKLLGTEGAQHPKHEDRSMIGLERNAMLGTAVLARGN